ncbi:hypothetical protein ACFQL7_22570 [Halocatena marina]|uniref:Halobacterial output domain-containing protein n=1 Tax=Halocatena marina TaxID=2934937 RepID=A0ABD5YSS1_9EURY
MSQTDRSGRLSVIRYRLSTQTGSQHEALVALIELLARDSVSNRKSETSRVTLQPTTPSHAEPVTVLEAFEGPSHLVLQSDTEVEYAIEGVPFLHPEELELNQHPEQWIQHEDSIGQYVEVPQSGGDSGYGVTIAELAERLSDTTVSVDHTGISIPQANVKHSAWVNLNAALADASCLYKYPTGEPWNFILPATDSEVNQEIEQFVLGRRPRFELVFDSVAESPVVQFALRTDLSQEDVESLFPRPYGFSPNGLEGIFRIVSVVHPGQASQSRSICISVRGRWTGEPVNGS